MKLIVQAIIVIYLGYLALIAFGFMYNIMVTPIGAVISGLGIIFIAYKATMLMFDPQD